MQIHNEFSSIWNFLYGSAISRHHLKLIENIHNVSRRMSKSDGLASKVSQPLFRFCRSHSRHENNLKCIFSADGTKGGVHAWLSLCSVILLFIYRGNMTSLLLSFLNWIPTCFLFSHEHLLWLQRFEDLAEAWRFTSCHICHCAAFVFSWFIQPFALELCGVLLFFIIFFIDSLAYPSQHLSLGRLCRFILWLSSSLIVANLQTKSSVNNVTIPLFFAPLW